MPKPLCRALLLLLATRCFTYATTIALDLPTTTIAPGTPVTRDTDGKPLPSGIAINEITLQPARWHHGTVERRFTIENPNPQTIPIRLTIPATSFSRDGLAHLSLQLPATGNSRTTARIQQPPVRIAGYEGYMQVVIGSQQPREIQIASLEVRSSYYSYSPLSLLVSKKLSAEELKSAMIAAAPVDTTKRGYYNPSELTDEPSSKLTAYFYNASSLEHLTPTRFEGEGSAWPRHWLAYTPFDNCLIAAYDFDEMPPEVHQALHDYAAAGGHVTLLGRNTLPPGWSPAIGFGGATACSAATIETLTTENLALIATNAITTLHPWLAKFESRSKNIAAIPVVSGINVPARTFLLILLLFSLLAGPGAILYTRRASRRIWLIPLIPAISLLFSLAIVTYALLSEGLTPRLCRQAYTLLDQTRQHAVTYGAIGVYAPVSLRDGLHFDHNSEIIPLTKVTGSRIQIGHDQHYQSGWIEPRLPAFFRLRRSEQRHERLVITPLPDGSIEVVNALGATLRALRLTAPDGRHYELHNLPPGGKALLSAAAAGSFTQPLLPDRLPTPLHKLDAGWSLAKLVSDDGFAKLDAAPPPGSYLALLDDAPFIENPLAYGRTKESAASLVLGIYQQVEEQP